LFTKRELVPGLNLITVGPDGSITGILNSAPVVADQFPITDELGNPLGLWLAIRQLPPAEFLIRLQSSSGTVYGAEATLEIEFDRPGNMNGVKISPFSNYPVYLRSIVAEGLTASTGDTLYTGNIKIDREQTLRFPRRPIRRLFLKFYQENYTYKEHLVDPEDKLKRDALASLQAVLPFAVRRIEKAIPKQITGVQYEFGIRSISGQDWTPQIQVNKPGMFIAGPLVVQGTPEVLRFDFEGYQPNTNDIRVYILAREHATNGTIGSLTETEITSASTWAYQPVASSLSKVEFFLKFVLKSEHRLVQTQLLK
jgi:hypothetical protein